MPRTLGSVLLTASILLGPAASVAEPTATTADAESSSHPDGRKIEPSRPAAWHPRDRVLAGAPVARTSAEVREMRASARSYAPSDPTLSCYYTEHIVNRCPQSDRP